MTPEYPELVLSTYKKMRDNGELYTILPKETTAALKNACLKVYDSRYNQDDADILSVFFNVDKMKCDFRKVISEVKSDYFKALYNHIRDETATNERNSDLLAWLINFKPRPSGSYYKSLRESLHNNGTDNDDEGKTNIDEEKVHTSTEIEEQGNTEEKNNDVNELLDKSTGLDITKQTYETENQAVNKPLVKLTDQVISISENNTKEEIKTGLDQVDELIQLPRFPTRYIIATCILLLFIGTTSFVAWENSATVIRNPTTDEKCMYWDDDHYEPVNCNAQINGVTIIPLDKKKLQHQRKINLPDTLTTYSLGKVWYKGFVKDHEFFTDSGAYPQDIQRVLKPLTNTILTKYTSNYRYMLTRLVWFLCAALFVSLCGIGASKTKKKIKISNQNETSNSRIQELVKQTAQ